MSDIDVDAGHESEEVEASVGADCSLNNPTEDIKGINVFGRLALTGQRKTQYVVTTQDIQRRIEGENMSSNVFRDLLGGRRKNWPEIVLSLPKKMKTKTSIFSALTEGEASELATGLTKSLCQNVSPELVRKDRSEQGQLLLVYVPTCKQAWTFSLLTHTFGPQAVDGVLGFIIESLNPDSTIHLVYVYLTSAFTSARHLKYIVCSSAIRLGDV
ncbi:hypothetical protein IRJ41_013843 [Triplophysa rosa]|uniref:Transcription factor AP-2 C-terminal domain-containing protein n=1 Tax=Triplophysa rosa TaxID=992332 RepID=A0A9W7W843_TRIRA|nr:hypothetical protein IRJ41_013843 [Triplophysa rosa]